VINTGVIMDINQRISFRARFFFLLLMTVPLVANCESIMVGDIEISPEDFSAKRGSEKRIAKCLLCHGDQAGGDIDFGPDVHFGTPSLRGMKESYIKESLIAYKTSTRIHKEMSAVSSILDQETINFMARTLAMFEVPAMKSANELMALAKKDPLFLKGQTIAQKGIPQQGVPACIACHEALGEGGEVGPRLAGQNMMYVKNQFESFANGARQTVQSAVMQPVVAGLTAADIEAVAYYYESIPEASQP
jgi:cytochrome c553